MHSIKQKTVKGVGLTVIKLGYFLVWFGFAAVCRWQERRS